MLGNIPKCPGWDDPDHDLDRCPICSAWARHPECFDPEPFWMPILGFLFLLTVLSLLWIAFRFLVS